MLKPTYVILLSALLNGGVSLAQTRPNILFLAVDDLNHWVRHLAGHPGTLTPNIDRFAAEGVTFEWTNLAVAPLANNYRKVMDQLARHLPKINVSGPD